MQMPLAVLYVEDDPDIREIGRIALEEIGGCQLCVCASGDEALTAIRSFHPDMLLLDVMMPGMDGPTLLSLLRQAEPPVLAPAVFMTARVQSSEVDAYLRMGATKVIPKPFDPLTLAADLRAVLTR